MKYDINTMSENMQAFQEGRMSLAAYSMEVVGDVNELNPLVMLRLYEEKESVDVYVQLASQFLLNKEIRFYHNGVEVTRFIYKGGDLGEAFKDYPFLLDLCLKYCYSILLKKLAAPSKSSVIEEQPSAN